MDSYEEYDKKTKRVCVFCGEDYPECERCKGVGYILSHETCEGCGRDYTAYRACPVCLGEGNDIHYCFALDELL